MGAADEIRRRYVGGHDASAIVGASPWESPLSVYLRKRGELPDVPKDPEKAKWGLRLEPVILAGYAEQRGVSLRKGSRIMDPVKEFFGGTPDALVVEAGAADIAGGVDAKSVDPRVAWRWGDPSEGTNGVPDHLAIQAQWYMARSGLPWWEVAALFGSSELLIYRIPKDPEVIAWLDEACEKFWKDHVLAARPPRADGHEATTAALAHLYPKQKGPPKQSTPELDGIAKTLEDAKKALAKAELDVETCNNLIKAFIGDAEAVVGSDWRATWKAQTANRLDVKTIKADADAGNEQAKALIAKYATTTESRPLRVTPAAKMKVPTGKTDL